MNFVTRSSSSSLSATSPSRPARVIEQARLGLLVHKIDHFREDRFGRMKKLGVIARDPLIPVSVRLPFSAVG